MRPAQIIAAQLEVHCPYCGDPQPNSDDGTDVWTPEEVRSNSGGWECVACDKTFLLSPVSMAQVRACDPTV